MVDKGKKILNHQLESMGKLAFQDGVKPFSEFTKWVYHAVKICSYGCVPAHGI